MSDVKALEPSEIIINKKERRIIFNVDCSGRDGEVIESRPLEGSEFSAARPPLSKTNKDLPPEP